MTGQNELNVKPKLNVKPLKPIIYNVTFYHSPKIKSISGFKLYIIVISIGKVYKTHCILLLFVGKITHQLLNESYQKFR